MIPIFPLCVLPSPGPVRVGAHMGPYGPLWAHIWAHIWAHVGPYRPHGPLWAQKGLVGTDHLWTYHVAAPDRSGV